MGRRLLHIAGRPCSLRQRGRNAPTANEAEGFLDLLVSESVYDRVDDGIVGGRQEGGVGIDGGVGVIGDQGIEGERHPAGSKGPQDESQSRDPFPGGHVERCSQEVVLQGYLMGVPHHNLTNLDVELKHQGKHEEEGDGEDGSVVLSERSDHAAGGLGPQAVPAQDRQPPQADGGFPRALLA